MDPRPRPTERAVFSSPERDLLIAAAAFAAVLATNLISLEADHLRQTILNANWRLSWSHDLDTLLLALAAYASIIGARRPWSPKLLWRALTLILTLFFVDEISPLHADIGSVSGGKLLYAPILLALVTCVWLLVRGTSERRIVQLGLLTLFVAFGMHVPGLHILRPLGYTNVIYQGGVGFKEGTTLAGLVLVVPALWRLAKRRSGSSIRAS